MPRKAPKDIIEHRITLGNYERQRIDELITTYQAKSVATSTANLLGSISLPMLGVAALIWVGYGLTEIVDDVKKWTKTTGSNIANWMTENGLINYTADEIGRAIKEAEEEQAALVGEMGANVQRYCDPNSPEFNKTKCNNLNAEGARLEKKIQTLRKMLNQIAEGELPIYGAGWLLFTGKGDIQAHKDILDTWYVREYLEEYGDEGDKTPPDWEIEV